MRAMLHEHPIDTTIFVLFVVWIAWEVWCVYHPATVWCVYHPATPRPKIPVDVGKLNVTVVWIDISRSFDYEVKGSCWGFWQGKPDVWDATKEARNFVEDEDPIDLGDNMFAPRHRVHRYIIGERKEHIIEI